MPLLLLVALAAAAAGVSATNSTHAVEPYRGYRLLKATPATREQVALLHDLETSHSADFLRRVRLGMETRFMVPPAKLEPVVAELKKAGVPFEIVVQDVQELIAAEKKQHEMARAMRAGLNGDVTFDTYMRYSEINQYLKSLASRFPGLVAVESIGKSFQGRDINVVKISGSAGGPARRGVLVDAGIHAREWIAPATALYLIRELAEAAEDNVGMLEGIDWYIIPLLNPDGYEYSHERERLWRKNRSYSTGKRCPGTDVNRNFGFHWNPAIGGSTSPCSMTYSGPKAFSELESQHFRDFVLRTNQDQHIKMYLTLHSYGPFILYPWGFTTILPADVEELDSIAQGANKAMVGAGSQSYVIGSSTNTLYPAAGGSDDWAKGEGGIAKAYTIELPPGGPQGFDMPPHMIRETARQALEGFRAFATRARALD